MKQHEIPCQYETGKVVPDYHPLSESEVFELLLTARRCLTYEDMCIASQEIASIQCRLDQGIMGYVNPPRISGNVAEKQYQIDRMYVHFVEHPEEYVNEIEQLAKELHQLMQL